MKTLALPFIGRFDRNTSSFGPKNWGLAIFDELLWGLRQLRRSHGLKCSVFGCSCCIFDFPCLSTIWKTRKWHRKNLQVEICRRPVGDLPETFSLSRGPQTLTGSVSFPVSFSCCFVTMVSAPDQQAHRVHAQVRLPRFVLLRCPISGVIWLVVSTYPSEKWWSSSVGKDDIMTSHIWNGKYWKIKFMFELPSGSQSSSFRAHRRKDCRNHILQGLLKTWRSASPSSSFKFSQFFGMCRS